MFLDEDDALFFHLAMLGSLPAWNQYEGCTQVHESRWMDIFRTWEAMAAAQALDELGKIVCGESYPVITPGREARAYILSHNARLLEKSLASERYLYHDFRRWAEAKFAKGYRYITVYGF